MLGWKSLRLPKERLLKLMFTGIQKHLTSIESKPQLKISLPVQAQNRIKRKSDNNNAIIIILVIVIDHSREVLQRILA